MGDGSGEHLISIQRSRSNLRLLPNSAGIWQIGMVPTPSPKTILSSMGNNVDTFLAAAMGVEPLVDHDRRNRIVVRSPRGTPRLLVVPLLILPSCMVLLFVVLLCRSFLEDLSEPLLEHIAQERSLCSRGQSRQWCCGHRGARTLAPENTMASFLTSLQVLSTFLEQILSNNVFLHASIVILVYHTIQKLVSWDSSSDDVVTVLKTFVTQSSLERRVTAS